VDLAASVVKKTARKYSQQFFQQGGCCTEDEKSRFLTNISLYLGNDIRYGHSYNEDE